MRLQHLTVRDITLVTVSVLFPYVSYWPQLTVTVINYLFQFYVAGEYQSRDYYFHFWNMFEVTSK